MKRFLRFLALAVIGFSLGVGFALFQKYREAPPAIVGEAPDAMTTADAMTPIPTAEDTEILPNAPAMPMIEDAKKAEDGTQGVTHDAPTPAVASSSVGGAFTLTDMNGNTVTEKSWPGKLKLVFFGFTRCPDICPASLDKVETALNSLGNPQNIQPIFITTDPERDDVDNMKMYVHGYDMNLIGLTGTKDQVKEAMKSYKVYAAKIEPEEGQDPNVYLMTHSAYIYLVDGEENLLMISNDEDTAETLAAKLKPFVKMETSDTETAPE